MFHNLTCIFNLYKGVKCLSGAFCPMGWAFLPHRWGKTPIFVGNCCTELKHMIIWYFDLLIICKHDIPCFFFQVCHTDGHIGSATPRWGNPTHIIWAGKASWTPETTPHAPKLHLPSSETSHEQHSISSSDLSHYHHFFLPQFLKLQISVHPLWTFLRHPSFRIPLNHHPFQSSSPRNPQFNPHPSWTRHPAPTPP